MGQIIKEKQDMTYLSWSRIRHSSGTAGSFLKSYSELGGTKTYYKLSNFDPARGVIGHECVNEIIVDRLLDILGIEHLSYQLIHADILVSGQPYDVYLCASEDFKKPGESKIALDAYYELEKADGETPLQFCIRSGWEEYIYRMLIVDFLILNRDRHGANIEVLRSSRKRTIRLSPLFDHGLSLLFHCVSDDAIQKYDVTEDKQTNNYIGSRSTWDNLKLIPADRMPRLDPLRESDRAVLLGDLDGVIAQNLQDKIWDMIWKRWCAYEDFCHSR
jgi:hypothetical protein